MLKDISRRFVGIFENFSRKKITEEHITETLREIRLALIESDVNLSVIRSFIDRVRQKALGMDIVKGVTGSQAFIKIVHGELVNFLGGERVDLRLREPTQTTQLLLCGLQGSGKTTTAGKLARLLKTKRDVLLVSLDIYRPSANEQLKQLAQRAEVAFFDRGEEKKLKTIIKEARRYAKKRAHNLIIWDSAGRTQMDKELLQELKDVARWVEADETLFVCDAMLGQKAADIAREFKETVSIDGLVFTKFDSEARGGAVLSVKEVVGAPVKYVGIGEKIEDIDVFDARRVADRMLGMGDVVGLVEKAQSLMDEKEAQRLEEKIRKQEFDLSDFANQIRQMKKMGSMSSLLSMIPGLGSKLDGINVDDNKLYKLTVIIDSMTPMERAKPFLINQSRKSRIAKGSGTSVVEVNQLLKQYQQTRDMMKKASKPEQMKKMMEKMGLDSSENMDLSVLEKKFKGKF